MCLFVKYIKKNIYHHILLQVHNLSKGAHITASQRKINLSTHEYICASYARNHETNRLGTGWKKSYFSFHSIV